MEALAGVSGFLVIYLPDGSSNIGWQDQYEKDQQANGRQVAVSRQEQANSRYDFQDTRQVNQSFPEGNKVGHHHGHSFGESKMGGCRKE